jgi:hypothetical protein
MKKRKMKAPKWNPRPAAPRPAAAPQAAPGASGPDMALAALRIVLMQRCEGVARDMTPILRHLSEFGDGLRDYVLSVPGMDLEEVKRGLTEVGKISLALKALGRLGIGGKKALEKAPETPATPAPGSERKQ